MHKGGGDVIVGFYGTKTIKNRSKSRGGSNKKHQNRMVMMEN